MAENKSKKRKISPLTVGIAGTAVVAAGAAAVALSKKENRKKAGKVLKNMKAKGEDLTKRAAAGLDKALKEEQKVREKAQKLSSKAKSVAAKVKSVKPKSKVASKTSTTSSRQKARTQVVA